jgi:cell division protein FtsI (penicillin-binding protein 3)
MSGEEGDRPVRRHGPRRPANGLAAGAIIRRRPDRRTPGRRRSTSRTGTRSSSYGDDGVASLGEARAHRRLRRDQQHAERREIKHHPSRPRFPGARARTRARRTIKTTRPSLVNRFGAGRPRARLIWTLVVLVLVLGGVLGKIGLMQGTGGETLRAQAAELWTRSRQLPAQRGTIFDRNGDELALSVPASTIAVNPRQVLDASGTIDALGDLLDLSDERRTELLAEMESCDCGFLYVVRQADPRVGAQVSSLGLVGVTVYDEDRRIMPGGNTGRSVIGRTDIDGVGTAGLERQYHALLQGSPGEMTLEVAPGGRAIAGTEHVLLPATPGTDLVTTIDRSVQYQAEQVLVRQVGVTGAVGGQIIVMDTHTGDVIAMVSVDRNEQGVPVVSGGNFAAVGAYEPGSVGKVITLAGAIEDGAVTPDTMFGYVPWEYDCTIDEGGVLHDSHPHDPWSLTTAGVLVESSNVGTILVSKTIGYERLDHYMRAFGLGERTDLNFPDESPGILKPWNDWTGTERCTVAYGQGVSSTAIQLATAVNVIANDGVYVAPRLVTATVGPDGELDESRPSAGQQVVSEQTATQMQSIMRDVVCNGTAESARVDGWSIAGKTGTAYKAQADGTYFNEDGITHDYYSSFVGFFPAEDPQVTVLISIDEPQRGFNSGAQSAAPTFRMLVPTIIHELAIVSPPNSTDCDGD